MGRGDGNGRGEAEVKLLDLRINLDEGDRLGQFANAFRVVSSEGEECVLDFLVWSAAENRASVVSRVRVRREFLTAIRDHLEELVEEVEASRADLFPQCLG